MVTSALDKADRAGAVVNDTVTVPLRQFAGIVAGLRAAIETFRAPHAPTPKPPGNRNSGDSGMFI